MARAPDKELVWNVYTEDFNARSIRVYNIFHHHSFKEDVKSAAKRFKDDRASFEESVRRDLQYYFWSKTEWEVILSGWPDRDDFHEEKVSAFDQVMLNWDIFIEYVWNNRGSLK